MLKTPVLSHFHLFGNVVEVFHEIAQRDFAHPFDELAAVRSLDQQARTYARTQARTRRQEKHSFQTRTKQR